MRLAHAHVTHFKSIADSGDVTVDPTVTVLVGQNEAGKTAFLQALYKARPADGGAKYDREMDYPRSSLNDYDELHPDDPATVAKLTYELDADEVVAINTKLGFRALTKNSFYVTHKYGATAIGVSADEQAYVRSLLDNADLPDDVKASFMTVKSARDLWISLGGAATRGAEAEKLYTELDARFKTMPDKWQGADRAVWLNCLEASVPRFVYFDDYRLLPGRMNLLSLQQRVAAVGENVASLDPKDVAVLGLLRMAKVTLQELIAAKSYESITAKLEAFSNKVTDRVFKYWKQNDQLDVKIDVRINPEEPAPYNNGPNLHIRIYNRRHRVTVGFDQRSRGFIWFFSFLVWFDSVKQQLGTASNLILLLDEPGLSLHALAQEDFLRYIDDLALKHQTIYTTHSPFMLHGDRLHQVRLVEDRPEYGTTVTDDVTGSDPKTVFPMQAALGYTIAQNLFISKRNLLVEGPSDLIYLQQLSASLEQDGRTGLREDVTIVPTGGLDNVATFVALLGGNKLQMVVLHDFSKKPHQRLEQLQREKIIREKLVLNYGLFRMNAKTVAGPTGTEVSGKNAADAAAQPSTDVEDLISVATYLDLFNSAFANQLKGKPVGESALPPGDRIVERITRYLNDAGTKLRPSGGFNHYTVASYSAMNAPAWDAATLDRFEAAFGVINPLFTK
jgi:hypothetical protein